MQYMLLIYHDENEWAQLSMSDRDTIYADYRALAKEMGDAGAMRAGGELMPTSTATTLRIRDGKPSSAQGPFGRTEAQLVGFFLVECAALDGALEWAAKIPTIATGLIEVRQVSA